MEIPEVDIQLLHEHVQASAPHLYIRVHTLHTLMIIIIMAKWEFMNRDFLI